MIDTIKQGNVPAELRALKQWVLWKYEKRGTRATKVPYQISGSLASSTNPAHWGSFDDVLTAYGRGGFSGIGFCFSEADDLVGIDLDLCIDADGQVHDWAVDIIKSVSTYTELSPSGSGCKMFARAKGLARGIKHKRADGGAIELYSKGRYFTVTGHILGQVESCTDADEAIAELCREFGAKSAPECTQRAKVYTPGMSERERRALAYVDEYPAAVEGYDGSGTTFRLACVLCNGFELGPEKALEILLQHYNHRCMPEWSEAELKHKVDDAANRGLTGDAGYMFENDMARHAVPVSEGELEPDLDLILQRFKPKNQALPRHLLEVPGFVGDFAEWCTSQNSVANPILSLVAGISLQALLCARKVRDRRGNRTNLYLVALAPSGGGKQAPQSCIQKVLMHSQQAELFGGKVTSDSAIAADLVESPAKLYLWDEFGRFLKKTAVRTGGAHLHAVQEALLELWNCTGTVWKQKSFADRKLNKEINLPCCSFLGLTVPGSFWDGLEEGHLDDGFAARLMVIDSGPKMPRHDVEEQDPPQSLIEVAAYWRDYRPGGNLASINPSALVVPESDQARAVFDDLVATTDGITGEIESAIWSRAIEKAKRLALVYACSKDHEAPLIDIDAAQWAADLATWCTKTFLTKAGDEIVGDDIFSKKYKRLLNLIKDTTKRKKACSRTYLLRATKWKARDLQEVLHVLIDGRLIAEEIDTKGKGRNAVNYRALSV